MPEGSTTIDARPRAGCWFFAIPIVATALVIAAYIVTFFVGAMGRAPTGERVTMRFEGCDAALDGVKARVEHMGLGDPVYERVEGGFQVTATLPEDASVAAGIPATLAARGILEVKAQDGTTLFTHDDVADAFVTLEEMGTPLVVVQLDDDATRALRKHQDADPGGTITSFLDGVAVATVKNHPATSSGRINLRAAPDEPRALFATAEWGILLGSGPLPCPVTPR